MRLTFISDLKKFIEQANTEDLKYASYQKNWSDLNVKVSFGMGTPAKIPWIAFISSEMKVSNGFYPVYLYYKEESTLILAYGISETVEFSDSWPLEVMNESQKISAYFDKPVYRYGDSYVFKAYTISKDSGSIVYLKEDGTRASEEDLRSDLETLLDYYKVAIGKTIRKETSSLSQGLFYMEKQLEDFIIHNWENTELGQKYDLLIENGELMSQQFKTEIGPIDILVKDKLTGGYVVIELKRNQTSDDTVGQILRYMGYVKRKMGDDKVKGVIIAGSYDRKLDFALEMAPGVEVYLYEVSFKLSAFQE